MLKHDMPANDIIASSDNLLLGLYEKIQTLSREIGWSHNVVILKKSKRWTIGFVPKPSKLNPEI